MDRSHIEILKAELRLMDEELARLDDKKKIRNTLAQLLNELAKQSEKNSPQISDPQLGISIPQEPKLVEGTYGSVIKNVRATISAFPRSTFTMPDLANFWIDQGWAPKADLKKVKAKISSALVKMAIKKEIVAETIGNGSDPTRYKKKEAKT
jgi:hypothetical protein